METKRMEEEEGMSSINNLALNTFIDSQKEEMFKKLSCKISLSSSQRKCVEHLLLVNITLK